MKLILCGVVGSKAYGLDTPQSDTDRLGVYVAPTRQILGVEQPEETRVSKSPEGDSTIHELGKFVKLALACNPTILELLWLNSYDFNTWEGDSLIQIRQSFLSERARSTYIGYVFGQAKRLANRQGTFDPDLTKRTEKHGRHCWRLLLQGHSLLTTGELPVRLSKEQAEQCWEMGFIASTDYGKFHDVVTDECHALRDIPGVLPDRPDVETVNRVLVRLRIAHLVIAR